MTEQAVTYSVGGPGLTWREVGDEIVVLDVDGSVYFGLNATGAALWKRLADGAHHAELTATLTSVTQVPAGRADPDVDAFLAELARYGLLTRSPDGAR